MTDRFGQYHLLERIAAGGMGEVFKARLSREGGFEKTVAVKRILPALTCREGFEARFSSEARLAARLNHANIVHVYDFGTLNGSLFLAMEYVDGVDLGSLLNRLQQQDRKLPLAIALHIAADICRGLDYAHRLKDDGGQDLQLTHRDISPSNILLSFEGEVKVTDFGLADAHEGARNNNDQLVGKYGYMPPEVVRGESHDRRSDIYSLGLVLYEMLYGKRAFPLGLPTEALLRSIVAGAIDYPPIEQAPAELTDLLHRACHPEKAERFSTAREMLHEIEGILAKLPAATQPLDRMMAELFPDRLQQRVVAPERTILSAKPISEPKPEAESTPTAPPVISSSAPVVKRKRAASWVFMLLLAASLGIALFFWLNNIPLASVQIDSTPPGARVLLDDVPTPYRTPAILPEITAGKPHRLALQLAYHQIWQQEIRLQADEVLKLSPTLQRSQQACKLNTDPPGASVWLNEEEVKGQTPLALGKLPLGIKQRLRIEKDDFVPIQTEFIIEETQKDSKEFHYRLQSIYKAVTVKMEPENAELYVDGKKQPGHSPYLLESLIPNRPVKLMASLSGYTSVSTSITPARQQGDVEFKLVPFSSTLFFEAPPNSIIGHNGRKGGNRLRIPRAEQTVHLVSIGSANSKERLLLRIHIKQEKNGSGLLKAVATLNVDAQPWATLSIDGGKAITTPSSGHRIYSGTHRLQYGFSGETNTHRLTLQLREP